MWKAENWRGKINALKFVPCVIPIDAREAGETPTSYYPDPITSCRICGAPLWHYWICQGGDGVERHVGTECVRVLIGQTPAAFLHDEAERRAAREELERYEAERATLLSWWKAPEQAALRRMIVTGWREEKRQRQGADFYRRAYRAATMGRLSEKFRAWVERASGTDAVAAARRTGEAMRQIRDLSWVRASRYDAPVIGDFHSRLCPVNDEHVWGAPVSEAQAALVAKFHHRYRKQIAAKPVGAI
jgi:hypothetical protein